MSENLSKIKTLVESLESEYEKFDGGNKSAGTRARKVLQDIKSVAQDLRIEIQERKNAE